MAEAALQRLLRLNAPGKVSLAGAYALGYGALAMAQLDDDEPDWFHELDPLDVLFLGTAWPKQFRDEFEFANSRDAWLHLLRGTVHWSGVERFVRAVLDASEEQDLPVDEGELMLLVAARLERAKLDQRRLPRDLLPESALDGARVVFGPRADLQLPDPPDDATEQVASFWARTEVDLPHDGTAADALREGVHHLAAAGMPVHDEPATLLPALYLALVAADDELIQDAGARAVAWARGLPEDSPLIHLTDILLAAPEQGMSVDDILGSLFAVEAFHLPVRSEDRQWHSSPGCMLIDLAFELGYPQVVTRDGKVVRIGPEAAAMLHAQARRFEEKFGRPPGPDDRIFFDPRADEPHAPSLLDLEHEAVTFFESVGLAPAWIYAYQHTDGLLPRPDGTFLNKNDADEWHDAVDRYVNLHGGQTPDVEQNMQVLNNALVLIELQTAATDPEHGASLIHLLESGDDDGLLRSFLTHMASDLTKQLRTNPEIQNPANEYARAWTGTQLTDRIRDATSSAGDDMIDDVGILLAAAVATLTQTT